MDRWIAVVGLGASGEAAARLALKEGRRSYVSDLRADPAVAARGERLRALGADVELGGHDLARIRKAELVVVSPGIPPGAPVLQALEREGVGWISEPEFAVRFFKGPLIVVTGTNGKTTTAALTAHLLEQADVSAALGGNVGAALAPAASELALRETPPDWYVLELSSFQLAGTRRLHPDIGVLTNLSPDHLDRYPSVEAYYGDKARLFQNATPDSRWVLNGDDPKVEALAGSAPGTRYYFARTKVSGRSGGFLAGSRLVLNGLASGDGEEPLVDTSELSLLGKHNVANALAAAVTARLAGAHLQGIRQGLRSFPALPHRLEPVVERDGVLWVNDSKATNVEAARSAVTSLKRPLVVLLGGKDKGEDFTPLREALRHHARWVILYGEARGRLEAELDSELPLERVDGAFEEAVAAARAAARAGDVILLAPACSSFDMFSDYEARGRRFAELARGDV